ncbi:MAG: flippase-like domain-containing protein [Clostridia bacterium]|nr:flippase-like domain-containing protein [Clostridia bacterium]
MKNKKKYIWSGLFLAALFGLTLYYLLRGDGLRQLCCAVQQANPIWLAAGLAVMIGFVVCEAWNTRLVMRPLCGKVPFLHCLKYAFAGFYFSAITPSASGGQPAQMVLMAKDDIEVPHSALCYLMIGAVYQVSMLLYAGVMLLLKGHLLGAAKGYVLLLFGLGAAFNLLLVTLMVLAMFWQPAAEKLVMGGIRLLEKCHIVRRGEAVRAAARKQLDGYREGAQLLRQRPVLVLQMLLITLLQLTCMYSVPAFVYAALGLSGHSALDMIALQAVLVVAVSSLPLPGAVGASESVFLQMSAGIFTAALAPAGVLLSRGISFYAMLLISGGLTALFSIRRLDKARKV